MPEYVNRALARFKVTLSTRSQHSPHICAPIHYGAHTQLTDPVDTITPLDATGIREVQEIIALLLYYARFVNSIVMVALNTIRSQQSRTTKCTADACTQLLQYIGAHPDTTVRYMASNVTLHIHSNASYLSCTNACSRAGGYFSSPTNLPIIPQTHLCHQQTARSTSYPPS